jgi:hypothetical protein
VRTNVRPISGCALNTLSGQLGKWCRAERAKSPMLAPISKTVLTGCVVTGSSHRINLAELLFMDRSFFEGQGKNDTLSCNPYGIEAHRPAVPDPESHPLSRKHNQTSYAREHEKCSCLSNAVFPRLPPRGVLLAQINLIGCPATTFA